MDHWSDDFGLFEAMEVAALAGYVPVPDVWTKADFITGLCCWMITNPCSSIATCHDFLVAARGVCGRQAKGRRLNG